MALLAHACPSLTHISFSGHVPVEFLHALGDSCPMIKDVHIEGNDEDLPYLQHLLLLQPSQLPNVTCLSLKGVKMEMPDLSENIGILSLKLGFLQIQQSHWPCFPRKLKHLEATCVRGGPPVCSITRSILNSLQSIKINSFTILLDQLADLLRESLFPHQIQPRFRFNIMCDVNQSTAAHMLYVYTNMQRSWLMRCHCSVICSGGASGSWLQAFILIRPCMTGYLHCKLICSSANLLPILSAFPDLQTLIIRGGVALTDLDLHALTACPQLRTIFVATFNSITPMGVLALCLHLPHLSCLEVFKCEKLQGPKLERCVQLLKEYGSQVEIKDLDI